jgi:hypothetical protein
VKCFLKSHVVALGFFPGNQMDSTMATSPEGEVTESVQEIVSHLPGAQSLPDGFSVSESFPSIPLTTSSDFAERGRGNASESSILLEEDTDLPEISATELQHMSSGSSFIHGGQADELRFQSSLPETEHSLNFPSELLISLKLSEAKDDEFPPPLSNFPADLISATTVNKSAEKSRRFPVPLSDSEATPVVKGPLLFGVDNTNEEDKNNGEGIEGDGDSGTDSDVDDSDRPSSSQASHLLAATLRRDLSTNDGPLQDILESKIAQLEVANTGFSKGDDEESKRGKYTLDFYFELLLCFYSSASGYTKHVYTR